MVLEKSLDVPQPGLVVVIATGGTIAQDGARSATVAVEDLLDSAEAKGPIEGIQLMQVTSPNIRPEHWLSIARSVQETAERPGVSGIVVTHGTDTLEETAFFLDLTCRTDIPVIVVGAMRPSHSPETDGSMNMRQGVDLARSPEARGKGVLVLLNGRIQAARDITKRHSTSINAFESPNLGDLGAIEAHSPITLKSVPNAPFFVLPPALPEVPIIYGYAGMEPSTLAFLENARPAGLVVAGTGGGSIPDAILPLLASAASEGVTIVRSTRTGAGVVARNAEVDDEAFGFIASCTLNPQKSRVLLMLCLAAGLDVVATQTKFQDYGP
ncbi:L-asparaginase [Rhizobium leguminosarum bv. viciae]|nr:L-asparaginase [Rhizobium leguminosarum bv. viciae]